jgi:pilus assembly protein Flp/PilA
MLTSKLVAFRNYFMREDGQDLVEYALVIALIASGAVAAIRGLSPEINTSFKQISSQLASSL